MSMSRIALKEWAVVCHALANGTQFLLFRKGGIHEGSSGFRPEHNDFWLFPTGFHQSLDSVQEPFQEQARQILENPPPSGKLPIQFYCRIEKIGWCNTESQLERLLPFQVLEREALLTRFHYRRPGLYVLLLTVRSLPEPVFIPAVPEYDGCHSWVELKEAVSTDNLGESELSEEQAQKFEQLSTLISNWSTQ